MPNSIVDVQDGAPNPESYTDNFNGTVTDKVTGLIWQQTPPVVMYTPSNAATYCASLSLGSRSDWRLPTIIELVTLSDFTGFTPAWDPSSPFGSSPKSVYWTSTPVAGATLQWAVNFTDGGPQTFTPSVAANVRCVR